MNRVAAATVLAALLAGCGTVGRLRDVGRAPTLSAPEAIAVTPSYPSLAQPSLAQRRELPAPSLATPSASLFRDGAGALFQDQRARAVGDLLTIRVKVEDSARLANSTSRQRSGSENVGIASLLGLDKFLPGDPASLVGATSGSRSGGNGQTQRGEAIDMTLAAIVTSVLPNGNLVVRGKQELRVNFELRELTITGIVRPQDIGRDNSVAHSRIAEARIAYGGRGQLSDVQQARYGQQIFDILFPF